VKVRERVCMSERGRPCVRHMNVDGCIRKYDSLFVRGDNKIDCICLDVRSHACKCMCVCISVHEFMCVC
jgi:hypothetical protein